MRILADENFPKPVVDALRAEGLDARERLKRIEKGCDTLSRPLVVHRRCQHCEGRVVLSPSQLLEARFAPLSFGSAKLAAPCLTGPTPD